MVQVPNVNENVHKIVNFWPNFILRPGKYIKIVRKKISQNFGLRGGLLARVKGIF